jgi:hypothetical protein
LPTSITILLEIVGFFYAQNFPITYESSDYLNYTASTFLDTSQITIIIRYTKRVAVTP